MTEKKSPAAAIRYSAMNMMARREHSRQELHSKLMQKFPEYSNYVSGVLDELETDGLLDDKRFAQMLVESYARKGKGPNQVKQALYQKGISEELAMQAFQQTGINWFELAFEVLTKKFSGNSPSRDYKEQARQKRFLHYRGFTGEQIQFCFEDKCFEGE